MNKNIKETDIDRRSERKKKENLYCFLPYHYVQSRGSMQTLKNVIFQLRHFCSSQKQDRRRK